MTNIELRLTPDVTDILDSIAQACAATASSTELVAGRRTLRAVRQAT